MKQARHSEHDHEIKPMVSVHWLPPELCIHVLSCIICTIAMYQERSDTADVSSLDMWTPLISTMYISQLFSQQS